MKSAVTLMLILAFTGMTILVAGGGLSGKSCSSQFRVAQMCYAATLPAASVQEVKKAPACCDLILSREIFPTAPHAESRALAMSHPRRDGVTVAVPLRPPVA